MKESIDETPDLHGFILAGTDSVYACHLPMFNMVNHMYQLTLELTFTSADMQTYLDTKKANPEQFIVLGNAVDDQFILPDIISGKIKEFTADVFLGLPDPDPFNPTNRIIQNTVVQIARVVYARHFDYNIPYPQNLTYILFGNNREAFLDHYMTREKDYMDIIEIQVPDWLPDYYIENTITVNFANYTQSPATVNESPITEVINTVHLAGQTDTYQIESNGSFFFDNAMLNMEDHQSAHNH